MNKIDIRTRRFDWMYLAMTLASGLLLYGAYHWYHLPTLNEPQTISSQRQKAQEFYTQATQWYRDGNYQEAAKAFEQTLAIYPQFVQARVNYALTLSRLGNGDQALAQAQQAITSDSNYAPAYVLLGELLQNNRKFDEAKAAYQKAVTLDPESHEARLLLAQILTKEGSAQSCTTAIEHAQHVLKVAPTNRMALMTLGDAQLMAGQMSQARAHYQKAIALSPQANDQLLLIIGKTYERELNLEQATNYYKKSIEQNPQFAAAHVALAGAYFALGELEKGFQEYEWRWELSNMQNLQNKWDGSDPKGKRIIVLSENGLGDILQYVRFAKLLKDRGAHVIVHAPKSLLPLFKGCSYMDELVCSDMQNPPYDAVTSMQSIPALMRITNKTLPNTPYIFADSQLVKEWRAKLAGDKNFKIGLCWQPGDDAYLSATQKRAISLDALAPLAQLRNVTFYCIQKNTEQIKNAPFKIVDLGAIDTDHGAFMDTAAIMKNMDLILSVDTSVAHLAGALGVPTWIMLPYSPDVRWMVGRSDCIWYPSATLFRQPKPGDWESVVRQLHKELTKKILKNA